MPEFSNKTLFICLCGGEFAFRDLFYTSFIKAIPKGLEEAARLDGSSFLKTYWYIIFPLLKPFAVRILCTS
ncbi:ABC transporter permease subunit [Vibrio sp. 10N.286.49.B1]|uniref:ABC transporter permease subunit n=1 Tax=unclassified Vibrio TaxID=2614977 RepID=UPI000C867011